MNEKNEIIKNWIEKGDHDLGTAQLTYLHIPKFCDTIAFHCQQATEKYLKGYLLFLDIAFKKSHDLNYLLSLLSQNILISDDLFEMAAELEDYSVEIRYPETIIELTNEDLKNALTISKRFREFVLTGINLTIDYEEI